MFDQVISNPAWPYVTAAVVMSDCLRLSDKERRHYLQAVPTSTLSEMTRGRGLPGSYWETLKPLAAAELQLRAAV